MAQSGRAGVDRYSRSAPSHLSPCGDLRTRQGAVRKGPPWHSAPHHQKGQVFSRIHVDDIAQVVTASINRPNPGAVYNVCDDDPAPPQDVISYAAELLELPEPPAVAFEKAEMTPMARSFYAESKKVRNDKIKDELGVALKYSNYREGLAALLAAEGKTR